MKSFEQYIEERETLNEGVIDKFVSALAKLKPVKNIIQKTYRDTPRSVFLQLLTIPIVSRMVERSSTDMFLKVADIVDSLRSVILEEKTEEDYIVERLTKLSASLPYKGAGYREFRGVENPTEREILNTLKKAKFSELRFTVDSKGKMWAWDSDHDLHDAVIFGMTGQKYNGDYAKGVIGFIDMDGDDDPSKITREGNLRVIVHNSRTVGTDYALKNKTLKSIAKRVNTKDAKKRVFWRDI